MFLWSDCVWVILKECVRFISRDSRSSGVDDDGLDTIYILYSRSSGADEDGLDTSLYM